MRRSGQWHSRDAVFPGPLHYEGHGSSINGAAGSTFNGAIYFPTTPLSYAGASAVNGFTLIVADTLTFVGNSNVGNDITSCLANGSLIKDAALVQ